VTDEGNEIEILSADLLDALPGPNEAPETVVDLVVPPEVNGKGMTLKATSAPELDVAARAAAYLEQCPPGIQGQKGSNPTLWAARAVVYGFDLGEEVGFDLLQRHYNPRCLPPWPDDLLRRKCSEANKGDFGKPRGWLKDTWRPGMPAGPLAKQPGQQAEAPEPEDIDPADVATIDDLVRAGSQIEWTWEGWLPKGVCVAIAAKGGTGKTRFCADLLRRVHKLRQWPDGTPVDLPPDSLALWVVADNHHDEMVTLTQSFGIADVVRINASKADPYGGVSLDTADDYRALEARVKAVRPAFVIVDTVGNATDKNLSRQEDAKAFYFPLQVIARKYRCCVLCLTHLNAAGHFLGRRVMEKVRVAIRIDQFDGEERRRLEVIKSNSKRPAALGVTMTDCGNDYDNNPPEPPEEAGPGGGGPKPPTDAERNAMGWLQRYLKDGPKRVSITRTAAEQDGVSSDKLYAAKKFLKAHEFSSQGYKWWSLTKEESFE